MGGCSLGEEAGERQVRRKVKTLEFLHRNSPLCGAMELVYNRLIIRI